MYTLTRAKRAMGAAGEPIPTVFKSLAERTFHIRRGQLTMLAAGPGVGKSVLAQTLAMRAGVPTLYFSADSDAFTMYLRGAAMLTGHSLRDIEADYKNGNGAFYDDALNRVDNVRWDFTSSPGVDDLEDCVTAFALTYGEYPHLIVVDNLINVDAADIGGEGQRSLTSVIIYLKTLAQETNAAVVMLHHLTGQYDDGISPAPLSALIEKVSKFPEAVLNLYRDGVLNGKTTQMGCCLVKNRGGEADPSGNLVVRLEYNPAHARLDDLSPVFGENGGSYGYQAD